MTNPYQPPRPPTRFAPFHQRLARGLRFAAAEYGRGLKRERLSPVRHFLSWCAALLLFVVLAAWLTTIGVGFYGYVSGSGF
ncbi:MAG: hypothetical protein AAFX06_30460 [Planctomycetota bacterium]